MRWPEAAMISIALLLCACSVTKGKGLAVVPSPTAKPQPPELPMPIAAPHNRSDLEIEDLSRIPQRFAGLSEAAGDRLPIGEACRTQLHAEFQQRFFAPWTSPVPIFDPADSRDVIDKEVRHDWYGVNKRKVTREQMQELLENCAMAGFPSRSDAAIAVAPGHLRGLPTRLPLFEGAGDEPFDMLAYPQVKLNEPLRVLHVSRDGAWYFVETGYSNGWLEARDVALVDRAFVENWMRAPHVVIVRDATPVADGRGVGVYPSKIGTILPVVAAGETWWEVSVASAGEGGKAQNRSSRLPRAAAAAFPLEFNQEQVARIGDQLLGQPYGWGEIYGLRDCSALLQDFFLPFGIWLPRTSADQVASAGRPVAIGALWPQEKQALLRGKARPFLSLIYKPGHIMLYVGEDGDGRPLVFHDAWSIRVKDGKGERAQIIGMSAITTLEPGKELGLVPGSSLLERSTEFATITQRCKMPE